jgi:nitronate monooxygenase
MIETAFTRMLGIRHPIAQAGMGGVARAELVAAVCNAGALGVLGMIRQPASVIREQIRETKRLTDKPFGINIVPPIGGDDGFDSQLAVCIEERVPIICLFWCEAAPYVARCHAAGIKVMLQLGSVEEARAAVAAGVDILVAQGAEAGGHVRGTVGLISLVPAVVDVAGSVPVLAAGGIADGRGLAAALMLGAHGAYVGTRFVASAESCAHDDYKRRIVETASASGTFVSDMFHIGWPRDSPHRVIRNALTEGGEPPNGPVARMKRGSDWVDIPAFAAPVPTVGVEGRTDLMANYAGQSVGLVRDVAPAAMIVERMMSEAEQALRRN